MSEAAHDAADEDSLADEITLAEAALAERRYQRPPTSVRVRKAGIALMRVMEVATRTLLRTGSLARVGLFDEDYFFSGEMADLCERLRADGGTCAVLTSVTAEHDTARAGEQRSTLYAYYSLRNRFLFIRKFRRRILVPMLGFWVSYSLFFVLRAALTGRWRVARVGALALADGLRGHFDGQNQRIAGPDLNPPSGG